MLNSTHSITRRPEILKLPLIVPPAFTTSPVGRMSVALSAAWLTNAGRRYAFPAYAGFINGISIVSNSLNTHQNRISAIPCKFTDETAQRCND